MAGNPGKWGGGGGGDGGKDERIICHRISGGNMGCVPVCRFHTL